MKNLYENMTRYQACYYIRELTIPIHLHHEVEIVYANKDNITVEYDGITYTLNANDMFIALPNRMHGYTDTLTDPASLVIIFTPERFPELADLLKSKVPKCPIIRNCSQRIRHVVQGITDVLENIEQPYREQMLLGYTTVLLTEIVRTVPMTELSKSNADGLHRLLGYCSRNYMNNLTLELLSRELYMNKYYISRLFNESLGISMNEYVNSLRINEAKRLLKDDNIRITEIAQRVGFGTSRTFNRVFLQHTGYTPRDYHKKYTQSIYGG